MVTEKQDNGLYTVILNNGKTYKDKTLIEAAKLADEELFSSQDSGEESDGELQRI